jgi:hypothetical protein
MTPSTALLRSFQIAQSQRQFTHKNTRVPLDIGVLDQILGIHVVEVTYVKRVLDEGQQKTSEVVAKVAVTCCGKGLPFR